MPEWKPEATDSWRALWIRAPGAGAGQAIAARREFECDPRPGDGPAPAAARVFVASAGRYRLYVNGRVAGEGPQSPTPPVLRYDCHDVGALLVSGPNCVAALVAPEAAGGAPASLLLKAEVPSAGFPMVVGTDSQWRACAAEWIAPSPEGGEAHDPSAEPAGWTAPGFDDSAWPKADAAGGNPPGGYTALAPRSVPPPAVEEAAPAACLREAANLGKVKGLKPFLAAQKRRKKGARGGPALVMDASVPFSLPEAVFDFGRLVRGRPAIELEAKAAGGEALVSYGETPDLARRDRVKLAAGGTGWKPLGLRAFRYLGISVRGAPKAVTFRRVCAESLGRPGTAPGAKFACSDAKLASAFRVARATLEAATADGLEERPGRPGGAVAGASLRAMALASYYMGGDLGAVRGALADLGAGAVPGSGARPGREAPSAGDVADGFLWALALGEYVSHTGDSALAGELLPRVGEAFGALEGLADRTGAFHGLSQAGDGRPRSAFAAGGAGLSFLMCGAYRAASGVARALGREAEAGRWSETAGTLGRILRARFFRDDTGLFGETVTRALPPRAATNAAAFLWGGLGEVEKLRVADGLESGVAALGPLPLDAALTAEALFEAERPAAALDILGRYFSGMARLGAAEFWEVFDPDAPAAAPGPGLPYEGGALAHGPGAAAGALALKYVLGIRAAAGGEGILLAPGRVPLDRASGVASLPSGEVRMEWKASGGRLETKGRLPEGVGATLAVPLVRDGEGRPQPFELAWGGRVFVDAGGRAVLPEGIERWDRSAGEVRLMLAKGAAFEVARRPAKSGR